MATFPQRAQAIGDALVNGVATQGQIDSLGQALAWQTGMLVEYSSMTAGQKAEFFVTRMVEINKGYVKTFRQNTASAAAIATASQSVDAEFPNP